MATTLYRFPGKDGQGCIDRKGKVVVEPINFLLGECFEDRVWFRHKTRSKYGFYDSTGAVAIPPQFTLAVDFSEGLAAVESKDRTGYINPAGEWALEIEDASHGQFSEGLADIYFDERVDFIRVDGSVAFSFDTTEHASGFKDGLSTMELEPERWGFIDLNGEVAIPPSYYSLSQFSDGLARVSIMEDDEEVFGFIDKKGKVVIELGPDCEAAEDYGNGLAQVRFSDKVQFIDKKGKAIWEGDW